MDGKPQPVPRAPQQPRPPVGGYVVDRIAHKQRDRHGVHTAPVPAQAPAAEPADAVKSET